MPGGRAPRPSFVGPRQPTPLPRPPRQLGHSPVQPRQPRLQPRQPVLPPPQPIRQPRQPVQLRPLLTQPRQARHSVLQPRPPSVRPRQLLLLQLVQLLPLLAAPVAAGAAECAATADCARWWPGASCRRARCACGPDAVRKRSASFGWACLTLTDALNGNLGPELTCPLPAGAGYRVVQRDANNEPVLCHDAKNRGICGDQFECVAGIGTFGTDWNGVCCPKREYSCDPSGVRTEDGGWLDRFYFDGEECRPFRWNPETAQSPNTFASLEQCRSVCGPAVAR